MKITNQTELNVLKDKILREKYLTEDREGTRIVVGMGTCGIAAGAKEVYDFLGKRVEHLDKTILIKTSCLGTCFLEPMVEIYRPNEGRTTYVLVDEQKMAEIVTSHLINNKVVDKYTIGAYIKEDIKSINDASFFKKQKRIILERCGVINPESIAEYIAMGGYTALNKVLLEMNSEEVIEELIKAGLRGRGGAGFATGLKWKSALGDAKQKYVICNADEGDPGAFMNRAVLEGDPHSVIESMIICGHTIGANQGFIYCRAEYPLAVKRLELALKSAYDNGLLGKNILNTDFNFDIEMRLGAGAFVCGEETALIASIEGKRGEPQMKPPFPTTKGLFGCPTVINNVNTFANITRIINNGSNWYQQIGTEKSKGTKVFSLGGTIVNTGLIEVPMGTTLREIIYEIAGGIPNNKEFKAAQTGGPSGGCIPKEYLDLPIDYDSLREIGTMMGSGGLIIMDENTCMVDVARFFLDFTLNESCGKCTPCRIGTKRMYEMLDKIAGGKGTLHDLEELEILGNNITKTALCGLGQSAPNPVLSTIRYFKDEYLSHINKKICPAGVCLKLVEYTIDPDKCIGCGVCKQKCPEQAIEGELKKTFVIDQDKCTKCGICYEVCKFDAITKE